MAVAFPLPNELVRLIIDHFQVQNLDTGLKNYQEAAWIGYKTLLNLSASCQQLRALIKPLLKQTWWFRAGDIRNKEDVIDFIRDHERLRSIRYVFLDASEWRGRTPLAQAEARQLGEDLLSIIYQQSCVIEEADEALLGGSAGHYWWLDGFMGSYQLKAAWIALLLGLMPRLEILHIVPTIHGVEFSEYMQPLVSLMRMQKRGLAHSQSPNPGLLANLRCLMFDGPTPLGLQYQYIPGIHLEAIFGTPSVRKLRLHADFRTIRDAYYRDWQPSWGANLTHLELSGPDITNEFMQVVSTRMHKLESFRFTWDLTWNHTWYKRPAGSTRGIFKALERLADTLTFLVFDERNKHVGPFLRQGGGSLKTLHKLRYLETSPAVLLAGIKSHHAFPRSLNHVVLHDPRSRHDKDAAKYLCQFLTRHRTLSLGLELLDISQWSMGCTSEARIAATMDADPSLRSKMRLPAWIELPSKPHNHKYSVEGGSGCEE